VKVPGFIIFHFFLLRAFAQESVVSTGGDINSATGSISYSIGQTFFDCARIDSINICQGVQQPINLFKTQIIVNPKTTISVYPNPFLQNIWVNTSSCNSDKLTYSIMNLQGITVEKGKLFSNLTFINLSNMATGAYFFMVFDQMNKLAVFKIFKV
jgi:hypothetical protein